MATGTWALGWATGDVVTAAEFKKGIGALYDTTLASTAATIDITGIVSTYAHLRLVVFARSTAASPSGSVQLRFNNDSSTLYQYQNSWATGTTVSASEAFTQTQMYIGSCPAASAGSGMFGVIESLVPYYASANQKAVLSRSGRFTGGSTGNGQVDHTAGGWNGGAINQVTLLLSSGSFAVGTRVSIYGMGA